MQDTLVDNFTDKWNLNYKTLKVWDIEERREYLGRETLACGNAIDDDMYKVW